MVKVKIFGAGSIGNHLAFACREKGWDVLVCDVDPEALERMKNDIYPARYGRWDKEIELATVDAAPKEGFDLVFVGTPPESHLELSLETLRQHQPPKVLLIEKPLCPPSLDGCDGLVRAAAAAGTFVTVGYNHVLCANTRRAEEILRQGAIGTPLTIQARVLEHWGGIFQAHPWLDGPKDSYLGFAARGGGACGEHSHSINIWQHFAAVLKLGRVTEVMAMLDMVEDGQVQYDRLCQLSLKTETGFVGSVVQDVITMPPHKYLRVQGDQGFIEWRVNKDSSHDAVIYRDGAGALREDLIPKSRPDDFRGEISHVEEILQGKRPVDSPISLERGLDTMMVIAAAFVSHREGKKALINYAAGYNLQAITTP
jgi:predicted dehydrogenase